MEVQRLEQLAARAVKRLRGRLPNTVTPEDAHQEAVATILLWEHVDPPYGVTQDAYLVMKAWGTLKDQYGRMWKAEYALASGPQDAEANRTHDEDGPVPINPVAPPPPVSSGIQDDDLEQRQTQIDVRDAIDRLDPRGRKIMLAVLAGKTHEEIARDMGRSQSWVSRLAREAQERLKELLEAYE